MKDQISLTTFQERTGLVIPNIPHQKIDRIVPLREIVTIETIQIMPTEYLYQLLRSATLEGQPKIHPYENATFEQVRIDPHDLMIGQTFVERAKYQRLVEELSSLFGGFCVNRGFAKCTPLIVIGYTKEKILAIAHYLTPIIEVHNARQCLIDGVHRNYLTKSIGTTIQSIVIRDATPPPCDFGSWENVSVVDQKPPRESRFLNLNTAYFRNLGWSGIDG